MIKYIGKNYIFDFSELKIMTASSGYDYIYSFDLGNMTIDEKDQIRILNELVNCGIFVNSDNGFYLIEPYNEILRILCSRQKMICVYYNDPQISDMCFYHSDNCILVSELASEGKKLRVYFCSIDEAADMVLSLSGIEEKKDQNDEKVPSELLEQDILYLDSSIVPDSSMNIMLHIAATFFSLNSAPECMKIRDSLVR